MRLIDADALAVELLSLEFIGCDGDYYIGRVVERDSTLERIDEAPTIEPVKRGFFSWFERENGNPLDGYDYDWGWQCSECQYEYPPSDDDLEHPPHYNFCPNCGADTRGGLE